MGFLMKAQGLSQLGEGFSFVHAESKPSGLQH
jgi:hypothetical protein